MAKIDNIPLKDHEGFSRTTKGRLNSVKKHYVKGSKEVTAQKVSDEKAVRGNKELYAHCKSPANPKVEATLSPKELLKVTPTLPTVVKESTSNKYPKIFKRPSAVRIQELRGTVTPQNVRRLSEGELGRLCKRGLMDYINRHTLEHINPSELRNWDKEKLVKFAMTTQHVK